MWFCLHRSARRLGAVTHVDGSARVQTVHADRSPLYHRLISAFGRETGVPAVLNTSFNLRGEPIVETPQDAVATFLESGMDALILGPFTAMRPSGATASRRKEWTASAAPSGAWAY